MLLVHARGDSVVLGDQVCGWRFLARFCDHCEPEVAVMDVSGYLLQRHELACSVRSMCSIFAGASS